MAVAEAKALLSSTVLTAAADTGGRVCGVIGLPLIACSCVCVVGKTYSTKAAVVARATQRRHRFSLTTRKRRPEPRKKKSRDEINIASGELRHGRSTNGAIFRVRYVQATQSCSVVRRFTVVRCCFFTGGADKTRETRKEVSLRLEPIAYPRQHQRLLQLATACFQLKERSKWCLPCYLFFFFPR